MIRLAAIMAVCFCSIGCGEEEYEWDAPYDTGADAEADGKADCYWHVWSEGGGQCGSVMVCSGQGRLHQAGDVSYGACVLY